MFRSGYSKAAEELALRNVKLFREKGFKKIITICSGCYRTLKMDYPEVLGDVGFEVYHITEVISSLLEEKKIKLDEVAGG